MKMPKSLRELSTRHILTVAAMLVLMNEPLSVRAQVLQSSDNVVRNDGVPRQLKGVTVDQKLGDRIPSDLTLIDSTGRQVSTGYYFRGDKPVLVTLNYSSCPMLCSVQLNQMTQSLSQLDLQIGKDFKILTVSIDPNETTETTAKTKQNYLQQLTQSQPDAETGWAFCTASQSDITKLADSLGFRYRYDKPSGEYYHPAMVAYVSPDGVITRYSLDVGFDRKDMKIALVEAGKGTVGNVVDQFILWCSNFDPDENSYVPQAWIIMKLCGAATVGLVLVSLVPYWIGRKGHPDIPSRGETDSPIHPPGAKPHSS